MPDTYDKAHDHTEFQDTQPLRQVFNAETNALIRGDLGDAGYAVDSAVERLELTRQIQQSRQATVVVVVNTNDPANPQLLVNFSSNIFEIDEQKGTMEFDLPMAAPFIGHGHALRGSAKLQGVLLTFEAETLETRISKDGKENALIAKLPHTVYRLQRRDNFRVPVPKGTGIEVSLVPGVPYLEKVHVLDISCGGVSLLVKAPPDEVHVGMRFKQGKVALTSAARNSTHEAEMIVKHARQAPPGLDPLVAKPSKAARSPAASFRQQAMQAMGATKPVELIQLGIEFGRMPMSLDKELARMVNELAITLMSRVRDD
jgi:c-di-GMP-binding flagellar brake protein YcgR